MFHYFKSTRDGKRLPALQKYVCGECIHINTSVYNYWGYPCAKIDERLALFYKENKGADFMDLFRFSPDVWVQEQYPACPFFEYNDTTKDDL